MTRLAAAAATAPARAALPAAERLWREGVDHLRAGRAAAALPALQRAVRLAPAQPLFWMNLATAQHRLHRASDAIASAARAFALDPRSALACRQWAELLRGAERPAEALAALQTLHADTPRDLQHHLLSGALRMLLGQWSDAAIDFLQVLQAEPTHVDAYRQLGFALANLRRHGEAAECFRTVAMLDPTHVGAALDAVHHAAWACDWLQVADDARRLDHALASHTSPPVASHTSPAGPAPDGFSPFCLLAVDDDAARHRAAAAIEARRLSRGMLQAAGRGPHAAWPAAEAALAGGRLRIGFVSADFRLHATSLLLVQTLERLPRERFEVLLYSHGADDGSALRRRVQAAADRFVDCSALTPAQQAERIAADGVALLVDLSGYTANTRLGLFALRPAPVQALWLAYPGTTGSDFVDYIVGDPVLTPLDHADDFSERIAQLPVCYEPTDERREHPEPVGSRAEAGLPEDAAFVYACFNQSYKITPEVFAGWCRILHRVPGSVLWLLVPQPEIRAALQARAAEHGLDAARLVFADFVDQSRHLARLPQADLFLDTFPYGAHTTCSDALWMGLPVLTRVGRSFAARVAASLLGAVGLPGWAVPDAAAYEDAAVALADPANPALREAREHLWSQRADLPLFDNARFTAEFAELAERMVGRWQAGLAPAPLPARSTG